MTPDQMQALREPFPPSQVHRIPRKMGGQTVWLDYVGHAEVTHRLLQVDPEWSWEPYALDAAGLPLMQRAQDGYPVGFWIRLTVGGVTRPGYGSVGEGKFDPEKELIGDAIRNAAMRFGVALDLWAKGDLHDGQSRPASVASRHPVSAFDPGEVDAETGELAQPAAMPENLTSQQAARACWDGLQAHMRAQRPPLTARELAPLLGGAFNLAAVEAYLEKRPGQHPLDVAEKLVAEAAHERSRGREAAATRP